MVNPAIDSLLSISIAKANEANTEYAEIESKINNYESRIAENQSKINSIQSSIASSEEKLAQVNEKLADPPKKEQTEEVTNRVGSGKGARTETSTRTTMVVDQAEVDKLKAEKEKIQQEITQAKAEIASAQTEAEEATSGILEIDESNELNDFQIDKMNEVLDILDDSKRMAQLGYGVPAKSMNKLNRNINILEDRLDGGTQLEKEFWNVVTQDLEILANYSSSSNESGNSNATIV